MKKDYVESVTPTLKQFEVPFYNCTFDKKKVQKHQPIANEQILQEMKNLSELFNFLSEHTDAYKSPDTHKNT